MAVAVVVVVVVAVAVAVAVVVVVVVNSTVFRHTQIQMMQLTDMVGISVETCKNQEPDVWNQPSSYPLVMSK